MFYQESKTAKASAIGTIMPWGGGITTIPKGWIVCDGQFEEAGSFPLLTQAIGDTYNAGTSTLGGSFPSYTGTIKMPDLNEKTLMDLEENYFTGGSAPTLRPADEDLDARTLLSPKIGPNESQSIVTSFNDVYTDIVWTLPSGDLTGYEGRITGNTKLDGEGFKTLYVAPRKLGRKHVKRHGHTGSYPTIRDSNPTKPGRGVIPWGEVKYTVRMHAVDNEWGDDEGDTFYFGWSNDYAATDDAYGTAMVAPAIAVGTAWNNFPGGTTSSPTHSTYGTTNHLYQLWWPDAGNPDTPVGFNNGQPSITVAKVLSTPPTSSEGGLAPKWITDTPISRKFVQHTDHPKAPRLDSTLPIKYRVGGGGNLSVPTGYRNYYIEESETTLPYLPGGAVTPDGTGANAEDTVRDIFMSHPGYNFLTNISQDRILAHAHDDFDIEFDSSRLRPASSLTADVRIPTQTDFLGNSDNQSALQIDFNVSQPSMTCLYIIRAY